MWYNVLNIEKEVPLVDLQPIVINVSGSAMPQDIQPEKSITGRVHSALDDVAMGNDG